MDHECCFFCKQAVTDESNGQYFPEDETYMCEDCLRKMAEPTPA